MKELLINSYPDLEKQWSSLNTRLFNEISASNPTKFWWVCDKGHEWEAPPSRRTRENSGCPYCANRKLLQGFNDLATLYPILAKEWHPTKNGDLTPENVLFGDRTLVWWLGTCGHEWEIAIRNRSFQHSGCPYCANQKVLVGFNDLATLYPDVAKEWHPTRNGNLTPENIVSGSNKKVWWVCDKGHKYEKVVSQRSKLNRGCPYCANRKISKKTIPSTPRVANEVVTSRKPKYFFAEVHPELVKEWSSKNIQNINDIALTSAIKFWWVCDKGHEYDMSPVKRHRSQGCPYCAGKRFKSEYNSLQVLYPNLAKEWNTVKNGKDATEIFGGSNQKFWWVCDKGHEWETRISTRTTQDTGCPYCANRKLLQGFNDLATLYPDVAKEWHPTGNGNLTPENIVSGSGTHVWWKCDKGHEWENSPYNRTVGHKNSIGGHGCPECSNPVSKAEIFLQQYIKSIYNGTVFLNDRSVLNGRELDLYVPEKHIAIEYNGLYWHSEATGKEKDYHYQKWVECKNKGLQLITVWEDDWLRNPTLIQSMLAYKLGVGGTERVYGRNTRVRNINPLEAQLFLNQHHIQGSIAGSIRVGLEDKTTGTLVAVMVLKHETPTTLNLLRYATSGSVIGGFTKLLKHVEITHKPTSIITFSDHTVSNGGLYEKNGFTPVKELPPDYMYIVNNERKHKFGYRLTRFRNDPTLQYKEGLTEHELALLNGLYRVYDAGKTKWEKKI